jgi:F0F1-type ATP synthase membrane subunit b/b'
MKKRFATLLVVVLVSAFGATACGGVQEQLERRAQDEVEKGRQRIEKEVQKGRTQVEEQVQEGRRQVEEKVKEGQQKAGEGQ